MPSRRPHIRLVLALAGSAATFGLTGCGPADGGPADAGRPATEADLRGRGFVATDAVQRDLVAGGVVAIDFSASTHPRLRHTASTFAGCNGVGPARYELDRGRLVVGNGASTLVGCRAELERQEDWFRRLIGQRPTARVRAGGDELLLSTPTETVTLGRQGAAGGPDPLEGRSWKVTATVRGAEVNADVRDAIGPTLQLGGGHATFFTGCNPGRATARVGPTSVTFSRVVVARKQCPGYDGRMERFVLKVLRGRVRLAFGNEGGMNLRRPGGEGLIFVAQDRAQRP